MNPRTARAGGGAAIVLLLLLAVAFVLLALSGVLPQLVQHLTRWLQGVAPTASTAASKAQQDRQTGRTPGSGTGSRRQATIGSRILEHQPAASRVSHGVPGVVRRPAAQPGSGRTLGLSNRMLHELRAELAADFGAGGLGLPGLPAPGFDLVPVP